MRQRTGPARRIIAPLPEQSLAAKRPSQDSSARFRRTRAAHRDETAEDYVEAIQQIAAELGEARVRDLARLMGVSHVTVTRIVARLAREGLVQTEPYRPVELTADGRRLAERIRERHETVLSFLRSIGVPRKQAEIDAEGIEHHVSDATVRAMRRAMQGSSSPGAASGRQD
jgi:DtxR family transcriptional regulator, manganese transport regulator